MMLTKKLRMTAILLIFLLLVGCAPAAVSSQTETSSQAPASSSVAPPVSSEVPVSSQPAGTSSETESKPEYNLQLTTEEQMRYMQYPVLGDIAYINANGQLQFTERARKLISNTEKYEQLQNVVSISMQSGERMYYDACFVLQADGTATVIYYDLGNRDYYLEFRDSAEDTAAYYADLQSFLDENRFKSIQFPYFLTVDGDYYYCDYYMDADGYQHRDICHPKRLASNVVSADMNAVLLKDGRVAVIGENELVYIEDEEWTNIVQIAQHTYHSGVFGLRADGSVVTWTERQGAAGPLIHTDGSVQGLLPGTDYAHTADGRIIRLESLYGKAEPQEYPTCSPDALAVYMAGWTYELLPDGTVQPVQMYLDSVHEIPAWNDAWGGPLTTRVRKWTAGPLNLKTEDFDVYLHAPIADSDVYIDVNGHLKFTEEGKRKISDFAKYEKLENVVGVWKNQDCGNACFALHQDGTVTVIFFDRYWTLFGGSEGESLRSQNEITAAYYNSLQQFCDGKTFKSVSYPYFLTTDGNLYEIKTPKGEQCNAVLIGENVAYADGALMLRNDGRVFSWGYPIQDEAWTDIVQVSRAGSAQYYAFGLRSDGSVVVWDDERNFGVTVYGTDEKVQALIPGTNYARTTDGRLIRLAKYDNVETPIVTPTCSPDALAVYLPRYACELLPDGRLRPLRLYFDSDHEFPMWNDAFGGPLTTRVGE